MSQSLTVFIPTIGRPSLVRMIASVRDDLTDRDHLVVASDDLHANVREMLSAADLRCNVHHIANAKRLGHWGHGSRNAHTPRLPGSWLLFADDDNRYTPGAISFIRERVTKNPASGFHLFRVKNGDKLFWADKRVRVGNIDTGCGVVANAPGLLPRWGERYEGDGDFYEALAKVRIPVFHDRIIYLMGETEL